MKALKTLFLNELADMYDSENRIIQALPAVIKAATCHQLQEALQDHLEETKGHAEKVQKVFEAFDEKARSKKCEAIAGILEEGESIIKENKNTPAINAAIICACQKVEHYEIASYGTLRTWASLLENEEAEEILDEILDEEKEADHILNDLSAKKNEEALQEVAAGREHLKEMEAATTKTRPVGDVPPASPPVPSAPRLFKSIPLFFWEVCRTWISSNTPRAGAALAYYTIFAIAPLFLLAISVAGLWGGKNEAQDQLLNQVQALIGHDGAQGIKTLVTAAANQPRTSLWATLAAVASLAIGATAVFVELQNDLNMIWGVQRAGGKGFYNFVKDRLLSFAMIVGIGFLLLVSLILEAALSALGNYTVGAEMNTTFFWKAGNFLISLAVITGLFAMILKVLPDVKIAWRDVWVGALPTALLFNLGKFLIGYYLGRSSLVSIYGAAGSLIILLMWIYYSTQIIFFGAVFTRLYAERRGGQKTAAAA